MTPRLSLTEKTTQLISEAIHSGFYKPGDRLPNELELADELGISRATLRESIKALVSKNVLEVRRGIGTYVSETPGLGIDPLGLEYICIESEAREVIKLNKYIFTEVLEHLNVVSFNRESFLYSQEILIQLDSVFNCVEKIASEMEMQLKYRLLKMLHEASKTIVEKSMISGNQLISEQYKSFMVATEHGNRDDAKTSANTFWDMVLIQMEEAK